MGADLLDGDVELTEFVAMDVQSIKGVRQGANGFPLLLMKGLAEPVAKGARDCSCGKSYDADSKADNCEDCGKKLPAADASKASDSGDAKDCPTCKGDGKIKGNTTDCPDCDGTGNAKAATKSVPEWHAGAARLATIGAGVKDQMPPGVLFKAVAADGSIDEQPDIDGGKQAIALIAKLISYEADELATGQLGEISDISLLCSAADCLKWWMSHEVATEMTMTVDEIDIVMNSLALAKADLSSGQLNDLPDSAFAYIEPGGAKDSDSKTTPRSKRHFAIHDKAHADNAAARIAQGAKFGQEATPKVKAAQKKFGESDTSKGAVAEGETAVDTDPQGTGSLSKAVEDAVTKATEPLVKRIETLDGELAKVLALARPGGPVMSVTRAQDTASAKKSALIAEADEADRLAGTMSDPSESAAFTQLAAQKRKEALTA
jgi:hypothetical protein